MLFSEPKIPQCISVGVGVRVSVGFSALQRAENSSIRRSRHTRTSRRPFQCSSASRKFLNPAARAPPATPSAFQCSSASRKFLNALPAVLPGAPGACFSALQRAENSSIGTPARTPRHTTGFQCSSASRKFLNCRPEHKSDDHERDVSVLFSEPKIPQYPRPGTHRTHMRSFSALQRAENSSILKRVRWRAHRRSFSALQRAENSSMMQYVIATLYVFVVSVLFSEPKIPQLGRPRAITIDHSCFSALQRAENSSIRPPRRQTSTSASFSALQRAENSSMRGWLLLYDAVGGVSVLFSEPKIPQSNSTVSDTPL